MRESGFKVGRYTSRRDCIGTDDKLVRPKFDAVKLFERTTDRIVTIRSDVVDQFGYRGTQCGVKDVGKTPGTESRALLFVQIAPLNHAQHRSSS